MKAGKNLLNQAN